MEERVAGLKGAVATLGAVEVEVDENGEPKERIFKSVGLARHDESTIVIPNGMKPRTGGDWLHKIADNEEEETAVTERTPAHPLDGAHALAVAISRKYGFVNTKPTPSFWGPQPPKMIDVPVGVDVSTKVPWGEFSLPTIGDGRIGTSVYYDPSSGRPMFQAYARCRKKHVEEVDALFKLMRSVLANESIYRGKAIKLDMRGLKPDDRGGNPQEVQPTFLDTTKVKRDDLIFDDDTSEAIDDNVFGAIEYSKQCRRDGIDLKKGVLLHGVYGTGKSLTATVLAGIAVTNNWTYLYIDDPMKFADAYAMAIEYAPSVLFVEDVDKVTGGPRDKAMDKVLNALDGIESKSREVMVVATTNEPQKVHEAFRRPGRFDVKIKLTPPNAKAAAKIVQRIAGPQLDPDINLTNVGDLFNGLIPASIKEAVNRARTSALIRNGGRQGYKITEANLRSAWKLLEGERTFFENVGEHTPSTKEKVGNAAIEALVAAAGVLSNSNGHAAKVA